MEWNFLFFINSILLGVGLAMDAFSVSLANGLAEPDMSRTRTLTIAGVYAGFQFLMPLIGWVFVHFLVAWFQAFEKFIPWIALILLAFIGGKMILESLRGGEESEVKKLTFGVLMLQGIATSIDALSVGFTIAEYNVWAALTASLIIAAVTLAICLAGLILGRKLGTRLAGKAGLLGGSILIFIGLEILIKSFL